MGGCGGAGREQLLLLLLFFIQRKVIGVLEGLLGLPACLLRSPAPSSASGAKRLSLQLAGRPRPRAAEPALPSRSLGGPKGVAPRTNRPYGAEPGPVGVSAPALGSSSLGGFQTPWLSR